MLCLHQNFNLLDLNLGLCIRSIENPGNVEESHPWLARSNVKTKLDKLRHLLCERGKSSKESEDWFDAAHECRCDRNLYSHAYWQFLPLDKETPVYMEVHPWLLDKMGVDSTEAMSLEQFEGLVSKIEETFTGFMQLRKKLEV